MHSTLAGMSVTCGKRPWTSLVFFFFFFFFLGGGGGFVGVCF